MNYNDAESITNSPYPEQWAERLAIFDECKRLLTESEELLKENNNLSSHETDLNKNVTSYLSPGEYILSEDERTLMLCLSKGNIVTFYQRPFYQDFTTYLRQLLLNPFSTALAWLLSHPTWRRPSLRPRASG